MEEERRWKKHRIHKHTHTHAHKSIVEKRSICGVRFPFHFPVQHQLFGCLNFFSLISKNKVLLLLYLGVPSVARFVRRFSFCSVFIFHFIVVISVCSCCCCAPVFFVVAAAATVYFFCLILLSSKPALHTFAGAREIQTISPTSDNICAVREGDKTLKKQFIPLNR